MPHQGSGRYAPRSEAGADDQLFDGTGDESLVGCGADRDPDADFDGHAEEVILDQLDLAERTRM